MTESVCVLVLAAGKGTRMHSDRPKVLGTILGEPMLGYVFRALEPLFGKAVTTVVGFGQDQVRRAFPDHEQGFVSQDEQLGTGHALKVAWEALKSQGRGRCLVVNGDAPLVRGETLARFAAQARGADLAFLSIELQDPGRYGRVLRDSRGRVKAVVEAGDFDSAEHGPSGHEVNAGIYLLDMAGIAPLLDRLGRDNNSGEYYITELVGLAVAEGLKVLAVEAGPDRDLLGVNTPRELATAEAALRERIVGGWLDRGALIHLPDQVAIGPDAELEPGAEVFGPCFVYGRTRIAAGARVGPQCFIVDSVLGPGCEVRPFSHLQGAVVGPGCQVGPFARLRPGAVLEEGSRVGNFVEMKQAVLGAGAKANHLTYLGDAEVGPAANIGAGTITCNYDGVRKHKTVIGRGAFIGSNAALVAPLSVGENALVGAGSTLTRDVPDNEMAIARARQVNLKRKPIKS
ncbi:MAG: bifunctional UDP-N-acetylglucosamine diphosphorylase/glucosamine-1-phosphate N-acetyltransferase GlmU [Desulfovibrionaceae bacterium]|nr:bifunctional UDP-N-acetylglucosamine diphosphorylase/glucosamine-1-phosphate N-acetyltransferase GlmU [Desulfovibrionaceae bacterium]